MALRPGSVDQQLYPTTRPAVIPARSGDLAPPVALAPPARPPLPGAAPASEATELLRQLVAEQRASRAVLEDVRELQRLTYSGSGSAPVTQVGYATTGDNIPSASFRLLYENKQQLVLHVRVEADFIEQAYVLITVDNNGGNDAQTYRLWAAYGILTTPMIALRPGAKVYAKHLGAPYGNTPLVNTNRIRVLVCDDRDLLAANNRRWQQR